MIGLQRLQVVGQTSCGPKTLLMGMGVRCPRFTSQEQGYHILKSGSHFHKSQNLFWLQEAMFYAKFGILFSYSVL